MLINICFGFIMFIVSLIEFSKHVQNEISAKVMPKPQNFTADFADRTDRRNYDPPKTPNYANLGGNECGHAEAPAHSIRWSALSCDEPRRPARSDFYDDADRVEFLKTLGQACLKSDRLRIGSASYVSNLLSSVDSKL